MSTTAKCVSPTYPGSNVSTLRPGTDADVANAVAAAVNDAAVLNVRGNGTRAALGRPVTGNATDLDLSALTGITLYEPEELVLSARAGTPLAEIEAAVRSKNQYLAFEPADLGPLLGAAPAAATLGGTVACNIAGPRRVRAGAVRDHILGVNAVSGRGEAFKSGGRVVKNVTGYDLSKLLTGSFGTLAVMTDITLKVLPAPSDTVTVVLTGADDRRAVAIMTAALNSAASVSAAAHVPGGVDGVAADAVTALRLEGTALDARRALLDDDIADPELPRHLLDADASGALWRAVRDVASLLPDDRPVWRLAVAASAAPGVVADVRQTVSCDAYYDWGGALIWLAPDPAAPAAAAAPIRAALATSGAGGHATLIRAAADVRAAVSVFQPQEPGVAALTRRIKDGFDPRAILNSGRMYDGV